MCWEPITLRNKTTFKSINGRFQEVGQSVPCGKCVQCIKAKLSAWLFRLEKEMEICKNPLFITLTYNTENLPSTIKGIPTLRKSDVQNFMKRLRFNYCKKYNLKTSKIRYFIVGEYGTKYGRPHYHAIMFNLLDIQMIHPAWGNGQIDVKPLKNGGTTYVLKYLFKNNKKLKEGQQKEFSLVSGGFGKNYLTPAIIKYHNASIENSHLTLKGGQKVPIPKYYKDYIYSPEMRKRVSIYMESLSLSIEQQRYNLYKNKNRHLSDEQIVKNLQGMKFNVNLKRLQETF